MIGGTGETGRRCIPLLLERGCTVRVSGRSAARVRDQLGTEVEAFEADLRHPESLVGLADGIDAVICAVGSRTYFGANGSAAVDTAGTRHLVARLLAEDRPHLVLLGAYGVDRRHWGLSLFSAALGSYFTHKAAAEEAVRASGLSYAVVRPVELRNRAPRAAVLLNQGEPMTLRAALRGVSRDAVAEVLVHCALNAEASDQRTFELFEAPRGTDPGPLADQLAALALDRDRPRPSRTPL